MSWPSATLGSVATIDRLSVTPNGASGRYIGLEHITSDGAINLDHGINTADLASSKFSFTPAHILFGKLRPYLRKVARPSFSGICSTDILPIHPNKGIDKDYLFHYLRTPAVIDLATARSSGANLPRISPSVLSEFPVPVPPLAEQKRIAVILDKADAIRHKRAQAIKIAEEFLHAFFQEMFGDPVRNPKGWPVAEIGAISEVSGGLQVTSVRSINPIELPYLRVANVYRDKLDLTEIKAIRVTQSELQKTALERGDILIVEGHGNRKEIGRCSVWSGEIEPCLHQNHLIRVRVRAAADPDFIAAILNSSSGRRQFFGHGKTTSGLNTISSSNVRSIKVLLPPLPLQLEYARTKAIRGQMLSTMDSSVLEHAKLVTTLSNHAFLGEI